MPKKTGFTDLSVQASSCLPAALWRVSGRAPPGKHPEPSISFNKVMNLSFKPYESERSRSSPLRRESRLRCRSHTISCSGMWLNPWSQSKFLIFASIPLAAFSFRLKFTHTHLEVRTVPPHISSNFMVEVSAVTRTLTLPGKQF